MFEKSVSILVLIMFFLIFSISYSQETGIFNKNITFNDESRVISFYVPDDYDPDSSYTLMVCLHGLGDNSSNFRNALINSLRWNSFMPNTIFVCPDGGNDQTRDFYSPAGDEEIIPATIDIVIKDYNIDTNRIILEGFSLGGRSALKYGLDNPDKFYGLLLNTPAVQGAEDARNNPLAGPIYDYENARKVKISITHGSEDFAYLSPDEIMYNKLIENDGYVIKELVNGMGHNIPGQTIIEKCIDFFDNPTNSELGLETVNLDLLDHTCNSLIPATFRIRNTGINNISSIDLEYDINGDTQQLTWNGDISSFEHADIDIPEFELKAGMNNIKVTPIKINDNSIDTTIVSSLEESSYLLTEGLRLPLYTDFEIEGFLTDDWSVNESGNLFTWMPDDDVYKDGEMSLFMLNTILIFNNQGSFEDINTPLLDLTSIENPALTFDLAFKYHKYTPPYFTSETYFSDTLELMISTDCGETFESIYRKAGDDLATTDNYFENQFQIQNCKFYPASDEWRQDFIDLSNYAQNDAAMIKFRYISGLGGSINIDNINFIDGSVIGVYEKIAMSDFSIYPNPANEYTSINFNNESTSDVEITVLDLLGNELININKRNLTAGYHNFSINTDKLTSGLYFIRLETEHSYKIERLIIE